MSKDPRRKILDLPTLLRRREEARARGLRVVQCHGCFDIVHPGHIRHLRQAASLGDVLLVTLTGDSGVNKGAARPLIPQELRAENLAELDCVDWVCVDARQTAEALLHDVRPDVYVKGKEYETNSDPRFQAERQAVERHGGRVVFTSGDVVFSSTALIAAMEQTLDPFQRRLAELAGHPDLSPRAIAASIESFRGRRAVVVGETILDTYVLCDRPEVAGESPVLTLRPVERRSYDGGAAIVARHLAALGARVTLVTPLPDTDDARALIQRLDAQGVCVRALPAEARIPEKQRYLVGAQKVMKLDLVEPFVLDAARQDALADETAGACGEAGGCDAAIIADFGLGLFSPAVMPRVCAAARARTRVLAADVSGRRSNLRAVRDADLLCPSETELREAMRLPDEGLPLVVWRLLEETRGRGAIVTLGPDGLIAFDRLPVEGVRPGSFASRLRAEHVPALCPIAVDPLGCGDALLSAASLGLACGAPMLTAAFLGACAAGAEVQRLGNIPVTPADLRRMAARVHGARLAVDAPAPFAVEPAGIDRPLRSAS